MRKSLGGSHRQLVTLYLFFTILHRPTQLQTIYFGPNFVSVSQTLRHLEDRPLGEISFTYLPITAKTYGEENDMTSRGIFTSP